MTLLSQFLCLLAVHWFADFVLQTHWQAQNKSKNNEALARHVVVYTTVLAIAMVAIFEPFNTLADRRSATVFVAINGILHFLTDYLTSRWSSRLYVKQDWHNFFVVIGLDQLVHQFTLAGTMILFLGSHT